MGVYSITDWQKRYETHESRKLKRMAWVPVPNAHDGLSFRRLIAMKNGAEIFGAWCLILQVASKMEVRGVLENSTGPLDATDLAAMTGASEKLFETALSVLSSSKIGWISRSAGTPGNETGIIPEISREVRDTVQDRTGQNSTGQEHSVAVRDEAKEKFEEARKAYPGTKRGLDVEWDNFRRKNKRTAEIVPLLLPAIRLEERFKSECARVRAHVPPWKNFATWINNSCWTQEFPSEVITNGR